MTITRSKFWLAASAACLLASPASYADDPKPTPVRPAALAIAELKRDTPVDFEKEILPFLKNNCLACHNTTKAKAGLNLESPQFILKGGETGPAVAPGKSAESLLFKAAAHLDPELLMPPKDNKANAADLAPEHLALLKLWIDQGAKGEVHTAMPVHWLENPPVLDPILAVALTQDGQFAACGRGNRIDIYHVPSRRLVTRLIDSRLGSLTNAAHRDLVNALAFNSDGTLLASAGFREVKLWRRPREVQKPQPSLTNIASLFAVSPDRRWLATPTTNHDIALFDLSTNQLARSLSGHSNTVTSLKFSSDSRQLLSGALDQSLRVWNVTDGGLVVSVETPAAIHAISWIGDDQRVASGGEDGIVRVWNLAHQNRNGSEEKDPEKTSTTVADTKTTAENSRVPAATALALTKELKGHSNAVTALETLPGGKQLLSGGADGLVLVWSLDDGKVSRELKHDGAVTAIAACPDGKRFASAGTNGVTILWEAEDGKLIAKLKGDRYANELVAESERVVVVAKSDVEFRKKSLETAEADHKKQTERVVKASTTNSATEKIFAEKEKAFKDAEAAKSKSGQALTDLLVEIERVTTNYANADKAARDAAIRAKVASEKAAQAQLAAERASASKTDAEKIAVDTASVAARTKAALGNADAAKDTAKRIAEESAAVAEKSRGFAEAVVADADMKSRLGTEARVAAEKAIEEVAALSFAAGQLKPGYDKTLAEAPDKRKAATNQIESTTKALASAESDFKKAETRKSVTNHELDLAQQALKRAADTMAEAKTAVATVEKAQKETEASLARAKKAAAAAELPIRALAFTPDGMTLATTGDDRRIHTWSAETGAAFDVFGRGAAGDNRGPSAVAFLDAQTLLGMTGERSLGAWELNPPWTLERTLGTGEIDSPLSDRVNAVRFSRDGQTLATGGGEPTRSGEIKLWNVADGKFLRDFNSVHSDAVLSLDFSPDGRFLASSSADRFVRVTDLASGKVTKAFEGHTSYVLGVAWKRDSRTLASAGADNMIKIWDFVSGERRKNIEGAGKEVTSIAFVGATGEALAASGDGQVRLVKENGDKVRSFEGATDFMNSAAATPDGSTVAAGGQDGVMRVWNGGDGKLLASFAPLPVK